MVKTPLEATPPVGVPEMSPYSAVQNSYLFIWIRDPVLSCSTVIIRTGAIPVILVRLLLLAVNVCSPVSPRNDGKYFPTNPFPCKGVMVKCLDNRHWKEPAIDQHLSLGGKLLMNIQGHWSLGNSNGSMALKSPGKFRSKPAMVHRVLFSVPSWELWV